MSRQQDPRAAVMEREYGGTTDTLSAARAETIGWLDGHRIDQEVQDRAALVLSELASNAIQASPGQTYTVCVSLSDDAAVVVAVSSRAGSGRPPERKAWGPAAALAARGRGLLIVEQLSDRVDVGQLAGMVVVTATLRSAVRD